MFKNFVKKSIEKPKRSSLSSNIFKITNSQNFQEEIKEIMNANKKLGIDVVEEIKKNKVM